MDTRFKSLKQMTSLTESFISGNLSFNDFFSKLSRILGDDFDGVESMIQDLPINTQKEVLFYSEWTGGEFGETEHLIPKRKDWKYGIDRENYSWIDQDTYRINLSAAYKN